MGDKQRAMRHSSAMRDPAPPPPVEPPLAVRWWTPDPGLPRRGRRLGFMLLGLTLVVAVLAKSGLVPALSQAAAIATVLTMGAIGALLILTERLVHALYAQIDAAKAAENDDPPPPDQLPG